MPMPELRSDPIVGRWVIIAVERGARPSDFVAVEPPQQTGPCPFCPGNESETPPEVYAERPAGSRSDAPGWVVRVISNKFPALQIEGDLNRKGEGIYDKMNGVGAHEVVIESPSHGEELPDLPSTQIEAVIRALRARVIDLQGDRRFRYVQIFKNHGSAAGATMEHPHTQLIAVPTIPRRLADKLQGFSRHFEMKERCILCDIIDQERTTGQRVVTESADFIAIEPFASRFPYETWVVPKFHDGHFEKMTDDSIAGFARLFKETLERISVRLNRPAYNFVLHTAPINDPKGPHYFHWHIEIMPKVTAVAGFEWGTGFYINPLPPEKAAEELRNPLAYRRQDAGRTTSENPAGFEDTAEG